MENSYRAEKRNRVIFIILGVIIALLVVFLVLASCNNSSASPSDTSNPEPAASPTPALPPCDSTLPKRQQVNCAPAGGSGSDGYGYQPIPQPTMPSLTLPGFGDETTPEPARPTFWSNPLGGIWSGIKSIFSWILIVAVAMTVLQIWHPLGIRPWTGVGKMIAASKEKKAAKKSEDKPAKRDKKGKDQDDYSLPPD